MGVFLCEFFIRIYNLYEFFYASFFIRVFYASFLASI
jgi:hypothetical protein